MDAVEQIGSCISDLSAAGVALHVQDRNMAGNKLPLEVPTQWLQPA